MINKEKTITCLMMKDIDPNKYDGLKDYYFDLIVPKGLSTMRIVIIAGPEIKHNQGTEIAKNITNENFRDLNCLVHLANNNPEKISFYLRNTNTKPYPHEFIVNNSDPSICIVSDANSDARTIVFDNPPLTRQLINIFNSELTKTQKIDFSQLNAKREILRRMNLK